MSEYQFSLVTPAGKIFDEKITSLVAPGVEGALGVLGHHAPMITLLKKGIVSLSHQGREVYFAIRDGILEVSSQNNVLLLASLAVRAQDMADAKEKVSRLVKEL